MPESTPQPGWYPDPSGGSGRPLEPTGEPPPPGKKRRGLLIFGVIVVFFVIVVALAANGNNHSSTAPSPRSGAWSAAPSMAGIGQEVRDGKFAFLVTSVDRSKTAGDPGNQFEVVTAQGEFLNVHLAVSNVGDRPQTFMAANQKLQVGPDEFSANDMAAVWTASANVDINPGNSIQAVVSFDIPPTAPDDGVLILHDSVFSGGAKVSLQPGDG